MSHFQDEKAEGAQERRVLPRKTLCSNQAKSLKSVLRSQWRHWDGPGGCLWEQWEKREMDKHGECLFHISIDFGRWGNRFLQRQALGVETVGLRLCSYCMSLGRSLNLPKLQSPRLYMKTV